MLKIYIAAGLDHAEYVEELGMKIEKLGHSVINSWHLTHKNQTEVSGAYQDLAEIDRANCCIFLTFSKSTQGGRYIEQGYALAIKRNGEDMRLIICGPRESCFDHLPDFEQYTEVELLNVLKPKAEV